MGVVVRQKVKGKGKPWWVFISHNGKRASKLVGDKGAAEAVASKIRAKLKLGEFGFDDKPVPTFAELAKRWINTVVPATCKPSTAEDYRDILRIHVLPVFGDHKVTEITRGKIKELLLSKVNQGLTVSTTKHIRSAISGVLNLALDDELIPANPALQIGKLYPATDTRKDINPLDAQELNLLLDTVQVYFPEHYPLVLLLARTGMRLGEALALQWGDIDFKGRFIDVRRSVTRGRVETPKSGKVRRMDMSRQLCEVLKQHEVACKEKGLALGLGDKPEWVFTNTRGGLIDGNKWRARVFRKVLQKAGLRRIRIHDLRHTYATLRISKGDSIDDVSNQLGHHSVKLTLDVYHHWLPGKRKAEVDGLDDPSFFVHPDAPYTHPEKEKGANLDG